MGGTHLAGGRASEKDGRHPSPGGRASRKRREAPVSATTTDAVNELDPGPRFVLVAHDLDGISMAQIAEDTRLPLSAPYKRRAKAIGALPDVLSRPEAREICTQKVAMR
ncbi:uncharacterized protein SOCE836_093130 [Sorangium cellulosum]|uniref:RNA polymerase sigma factor 70 region 4 type 2 domain-containing protein n=1 Tax=Sorangium cellulosum TaxID=56 RepID=A0A4P2R506_SORCE|nr:uncharacterized protein SOCE836_093130 [Sorangium cellulosum]